MALALKIQEVDDRVKSKTKKIASQTKVTKGAINRFLNYSDQFIFSLFALFKAKEFVERVELRARALFVLADCLD